MKLFQMVEGLMLRLSAIPGLQYLRTIVDERRSASTRRKQTIGKYRGYVDTLRAASNDVKGYAHGASRGPGQGAKRHAHAKEDIVEEDTDDSGNEFEYEEDDDLESYTL
jgi:hypothetical protein